MEKFSKTGRKMEKAGEKEMKLGENGRKLEKNKDHVTRMEWKKSHTWRNSAGGERVRLPPFPAF